MPRQIDTDRAFAGRSARRSFVPQLVPYPEPICVKEAVAFRLVSSRAPISCPNLYNDAMDNHFITFARNQVERQEFIKFWSQQYPDNDAIYDANIGGPLTPDAVFALFRWKNGGNLSVRKARSVEVNFIPRIDEAMPDEAGVQAYLQGFVGNGGPIWGIFWLHCRDRTWPIYDQHVHRAMRFIQCGQIDELPVRDVDKIEKYLIAYVPFYRDLDGNEDRTVDKALWTFGKFIRTWPRLVVM
jgi:hypothetical protein